MLKANCRDRFTAEDFEFMIRALARRREDAVALVDLLADQETRDSLLDHEAVYQELLESCSCLKVSPYFYFYVLTRRVLKGSGLTDRRLADYLALMLSVFGRRAAEESGASDATGQPYLSDLLIALSKAGPHEGFLLRAHVADCSLFISGIFADRVKQREQHRGGPGLGFYEEIGQSNYHYVSRHRLASQAELEETFAQLAGHFHEIRCALNHLSGNLLHLSKEDQDAALLLPG
ncbi:MAG: hypothetical protein HC904_11810 [Blastochloris sp.]|nr:hypothetical protein [Blastochloris sp.]